MTENISTWTPALTGLFLRLLLPRSGWILRGMWLLHLPPRKPLSWVATRSLLARQNYDTIERNPYQVIEIQSSSCVRLQKSTPRQCVVSIPAATTCFRSSPRIRVSRTSFACQSHVDAPAKNGGVTSSERKGVDINARNEQDQSLLHLAAILRSTIDSKSSGDVLAPRWMVLQLLLNKRCVYSCHRPQWT